MDLFAQTAFGLRWGLRPSEHSCARAAHTAEMMWEGMRGYEEKGSVVTSRSKSTHHPDSSQVDTVEYCWCFRAPELCVGILGIPWSTEGLFPNGMQRRQRNCRSDWSWFVDPFNNGCCQRCISPKEITKCRLPEDSRSVSKLLFISASTKYVLVLYAHTKRRTLTIHMTCFDLLSSFPGVLIDSRRLQSWSARDGRDAEHRRHRSAWSRENFYHPSIYLQWLLWDLQSNPNEIRVQTLGHS